ncbi:MAG: 4-(cytidine 5'-diphospho)-2-C-methyl-D-erythritol kinase [Chlamydiales bacterium]
MSLTLFSPAKINLFLRVLGKRSDGFHELASLFQAVDLGDYITLKPHEKSFVTCNDNFIPCDASNLALKALELYKKMSGSDRHYHIDLKKNVPIEAGLGGGSSNAATVLWGLNALEGSKYSDQQLQEWSGQIGSDIPFFFSLGRAFCRGRGEKVQSVPLPLQRNLWIIKPIVGLSTPQVYRQFNVRESHLENPEDLLFAFKNEGKYSLYLNDLEKPAFTLCPSLADLKRNLEEQGYDSVLMSGSGTSFFCFGSHSIPQIEGAKVFKAKYCVREEGKWYESARNAEDE